MFECRGDSTDSFKVREELAQLYYKTRDYSFAIQQLKMVLAFYDYRVNGMDIESYEKDYFRTLSQLAMCNARVGDFSQAKKQIDQAIQYFRKQKGSQYFEALRRKGKILMMETDKQGTDNYKNACKLYEQFVNEQYTSIAQRLDTMSESHRSQYWLSSHQFLFDCVRLGNHAPEMLYDLTLFSKGYLIAYEHNKTVTRTTWKQVKKELSPTDCAIEFVQYFGKNDQRRMGCLVLKSNSKQPQFIDLFSTDSLLNIRLAPFQTVGSVLTTSQSDMKDTLYHYAALPQLIWTPKLMSAIGQSQRVFFAPDGLLNLLAIEYLMPDESKECYRLSSTRNIKKHRAAPRLNKALLCGGITYNSYIYPNVRNNDAVAYRYLSRSETEIKELPGAKDEVDSIYAYRHNSNDVLLSDSRATDEQFLQQLKRGFDIVHISTHGYFGGEVGIRSDIKPLLGDQSMSKSGILFAGVSKTLSDSSFDDDLFDGVLSASELSHQDFSQTELVVLSACQTALGHLTDDGVWGIQRGLKQAGAQGLILSLWNVNDLSTYRLMRYFYENLNQQETKNIHQAWKEARQRLMQESETLYWLDPGSLEIRKKTLEFKNPMFSNPFILIDIY